MVRSSPSKGLTRIGEGGGGGGGGGGGCAGGAQVGFQLCEHLLIVGIPLEGLFLNLKEGLTLVT